MASIYKQDTSKLLQSAWEFMGERVRVARFVACCNYFSKKKKKKAVCKELCSST